MTIQITIDRRFCGPPESGNGGYVCGRTAGFLDGDAEVTLRRPPPLDTPLDVAFTSDGQVTLRDESGPVAEGRAARLTLQVPYSPSFKQAEQASEAYTGFRRHLYPTCFVCGPVRKPGDALRIFAGPLSDQSAVAAPWIPQASFCDGYGRVLPEFIWAALDCPGYFALNREHHRLMLLGRMSADIRKKPGCGERCIIVGWPLESKGRKHLAATALLTDTGRILARARATWIEIADPNSQANAVDARSV